MERVRAISRQLAFQARFRADCLLTRVSLYEPEVYNHPGVAKMFFYFDPTVIQFPDNAYRVEIHPRPSKKAGHVGFILQTAQVFTLKEGEIIKSEENRKEERFLNTRICGREDIFHLYDGSGKLVARMRGEEMARMHKQLTEEEMKEYFKMLRRPYKRPDWD